MTSCFAVVFGGTGITRLATQVTANAALGFYDVVRAPCRPWMGYWSMHLNTENILWSVQNPTPHIRRNDNIVRHRKNFINAPFSPSFLTIDHRYKTKTPRRRLWQLQYLQPLSIIYVHYPPKHVTTHSNRATIHSNPDLSHFSHLGSPSRKRMNCLPFRELLEENNCVTCATIVEINICTNWCILTIW
jgi:hypothetical protein